MGRFAEVWGTLEQNYGEWSDQLGFLTAGLSFVRSPACSSNQCTILLSVNSVHDARNIDSLHNRGDVDDAATGDRDC